MTRLATERRPLRSLGARKRARWLWFGGELLALVLLLFVAGAPEESALVIATLLVCPLMMLMLLGTSRSSSANKPQTAYQATPSRFPPSRIAVDKERSLR